MENYGSFMLNIIFMSVDVFFFSSGCLTTYSYLKDKTNKILIKSIGCRQKLIEFFIHIIKRFIRYVFFVYFICTDNKKDNLITVIKLLH